MAGSPGGQARPRPPLHGCVPRARALWQGDVGHRFAAVRSRCAGAHERERYGRCVPWAGALRQGASLAVTERAAQEAEE
eukprot:3075438-Alexandrium_andersonii.AAC.1